jgi:hypothetical protein
MHTTQVYAEGIQAMGEQEHHTYAEDRSLARNREAEHVAPGSEAVKVPIGDGHEASQNLDMDRGRLMDQAVHERETIKTRPSVYEPTGKSPLLAAFGELYIAKELYRSEVERRKEQQRKRAEKWRQDHPDLHRARSAEAKRKQRATERQQHESA